MTPEQFRQAAHELVDWMADYLGHAEDQRIFPDIQPGDIRQKLPTQAPDAGEPFSALIQDFYELIVPGMTHWNHPNWFAYFPANHSPPSILAEMLTATLGAQCMSWQTSPAATELEQVVMDWLRQMLGLSDGWIGTIQDTASTSTLVALLTARERQTAHQFGERGPEGAAKMTVYTSEEGHSSIDKAVKLAGYGLKQLRHIPTDGDFAMRPEALEAAIQEDLARGYQPTCVVATVGTTSSTSADPLEEIGVICQQHKLWLHVDAAYAGAAAILPEKRHFFHGIERADSFVFNPHKWLFTNFDCSAYYVRDVEALLRTFQTSPAYLKTIFDPEVVNFRDWGIQLGRRFRALKLWFVLRSYGVDGLQSRLREHIAWAHELHQQIQEHPGFEVVAPTHFALVCFRATPAHIAQDPEALDKHNQRLLELINATGQIHLTQTQLAGRYVIRMSIGQIQTTRQHVHNAWQHIQEIAASLT